MNLRIASWPILFALALSTGCKSRVGGSCDKGEARCLDKASELACSGGRYISTLCRGPHGCQTTTKGIACDISANRPGDVCSTDDEGAAVCLGAKQMLACHGGAYQKVACRGPGGCRTEEGRALCDTSVAEPGDGCKDKGNKACTPDGKRLLACTDGKMVELYPCRGDDGCQANPGGKLDCDLSVAAVGDPCDKRVEGQVACSEDRHGIVKCTGGKFQADERCKTGQTCSTEGGSIACTKK